MELYCVVRCNQVVNFFHLIIKARSGPCKKINNFVEAVIGYFSYLLLGYHSICTLNFLEQLEQAGYITYRSIKEMKNQLMKLRIL